MNSSGGSRVSIPENVRQIIGQIKQIAGEHSDDDVYAMLKECSMDPNATADQLLYIDTFHVVQRRRNRKLVNDSSRAIEENRQAPSMPGREARGGRRNYTSSYVSNDARGGRNVNGRNVVNGWSVVNGRNANVRKDNGFVKYTENGSTPTRLFVQKTGNNATPHATNSTVSANGPKRFFNRTATHGPVHQPSSSAGTNSSSSDPILLASAGQDVADSSKATSDIIQSSDKVEVGVPQVVGEGQLSEISQVLVLSTHEQQSGSSEVVVPETVEKLEALPANILVESANSDLDTQLEKIKISFSQSVIFPEHLHVPEAYKNQLTFGSLDEAFGGKDTSPVVESVREIGHRAGEPSLSSQSVSTAQEGDISVHPQGEHMPQNLSTLGDCVVSGSALNHDLSNQEVMSSLGGPPFPLLQPGPNYSFGLGPPVTGSHAAHLDGPKLQGLNSTASSVSGTTAPAAHPVGVRQSSLAVPPHLFPLYRPSYSPNYIPFNPYLSHIYMPQNAHQVLGHNGFPQPPSNGNIYIPPAAASAAAGVKFPVAPPYKPGTNSGLSPMGIPSGYASYGSSAVGFSPNAAMTPGSSAGPEELSASELKEKNLFSVVRQGENSHAWSTPSVAGPDMTSLQNYFYNLPQGQHIGFSSAQANHGPFAGVCHPSQTMAAPPSAQQHLHQSQAMAGSIESGLPPAAAYQHSQHAQMNWNSQLLSRENIR